MNHCTFHDTEGQQRDRCLFELVEAGYNRRERVLVYTDSGERAADLDRMLWVMKQESFIPHKVFQAEEKNTEIPVAIVCSETNPIGAETLIADCHCPLDFALQFPVVHEFVMRDTPQMHQACRERYRRYRSLHVPVEHIRES